MSLITLTQSDFECELRRVRQLHPLVHCMTNSVVQEFTADVLTAVYSNPAMIVAKEEAPDFARAADALLINVGTLGHDTFEAMLLTAKAAHYANTPWVLDPVAAGALLWRDMALKKLMIAGPTVIRANASEILALAAQGKGGRGVQSTDESKRALDAARTLAKGLSCIVALTGSTDYVTDGTDTIACEGGSPLAPRLVGTGCSLSALCAAFIAQSENRLRSVACACELAKKAARRAEEKTSHIGSFRVAYVDAIDEIASRL